MKKHIFLLIFIFILGCSGKESDDLIQSKKDELNEARNETQRLKTKLCELRRSGNQKYEDMTCQEISNFVKSEELKSGLTKEKLKEIINKNKIEQERLAQEIEEKKATLLKQKK